jgi:hypothetical protein
MRVGCLAQPGKLRHVADEFSSGREEPSSQRVHMLFDEHTEILVAAADFEQFSTAAVCAMPLSLLKRLREMVLGIPALIARHNLAAHADVPTPAVQAVARRP